MPYNIDKSKEQRLLVNIMEGNTCLFLGAGFSIGANAPKDNSVLTGKGLKNAIAKFAGLPDPSRRSLRQVYGAAKSRTKPATLIGFLESVLKGCKATWQSIVPSFLWKRIYTTNIDDVLRDAFIACNKPMQFPAWKHFNSPFSRDIHDIDSTQIVALHGDIRRPNMGFIFDSREYANAIDNTLSWHIKYSEDFFSRPFIFVGTQLDEPDLETYLLYREGNLESPDIPDLESYFVSPDIDDIVSSDLERLGIQCIQETGDNFFAWLDGQISGRKRRSELISKTIPRIKNYSSDLAKKSYIIFSSQFIQLNHMPTPPKPDENLHDFFRGDSPDWWDIKNRNDAQLSIVDSSIATLIDNSNNLLVLCGTAGCGKTTSLMRISQYFSEIHWQVYYFDDLVAVDVESALQVLRSTKGENTLVVISGAADNIDQIDALARRLKLSDPKTSLRIRFLSEERGYRRARVLAGATHLPLQIEDMNWLNDVDISRLIRKLGEKDKLRSLRGKNLDEQKNVFYGYADNQLLVAMKEISGGGNYDEILHSEYNAIPTDLAKNIYAAICLCHSQQVPVKIEVIHRVFRSKIRRDSLENLVRDGDLRDIVKIKKGYFLTRHPEVANATLKMSHGKRCISISTKADLLLDIMIALSSIVSRDELSKNTPEAKLVKRFMDFDYASHVLEMSKKRIDTFFRSLKPYFGWNSKYWAQRGLFESSKKRFADAIDFVEHAAEIDSHWTIRNTQGIVYLRAACSNWPRSFKQALHLLKTGQDIIEEVARDTAYRDIRNFESIIRYTKEFCLIWQGDLGKQFFNEAEQFIQAAASKYPNDTAFDAFCREAKGEILKIILKIKQ